MIYSYNITIYIITITHLKQYSLKLVQLGYTIYMRKRSKKICSNKKNEIKELKRATIQVRIITKKNIFYNIIRTEDGIEDDLERRRRHVDLNVVALI